MFNWRRIVGLETRSSETYTDAIVKAIQDRATGITPDPDGLGALEVAAGVWSRGLASADISPVGSPVTAALSPAVLASMGRGMVRRGEVLFVIEIKPSGQVRLIEGSGWQVEGSYDPESWIYRVDLPGPSSTTSRTYPASSVVHVRFAVHPSSPWKGISPLSFACSTGSLGANLETRLGEETSGPVGYVLPIPSDGGDGTDSDPLKQLRTDLAALSGGISLVETTSGGWSEGRGSAPQRDWVPQRLGAKIPQGNVDLWSDVGRVILAANGIPPALADASAEGSSQRESWRRFLHGSLKPCSRIIESELSTKLDTKISLGFAGLFASDLQGRARAFSSMTGTDGNLTAEQAARICGFDMEGG